MVYFGPAALYRKKGCRVMDRLTSMEVFARVVETGSFAKAADAMGLSRGMVSKHVMALEERLGVRLLNRTTRKLNLTEVGSGYYDRCRQIVNEAWEAEQAATQLNAEPRGELRVNAPMTFGTKHLGPALPHFLDRYPDVTVDLTLNDRVIDLIDEGFDLAIRIGQLSDSSLIARRLAPARSVVCASPSYLRTRGIPEHPTQLQAHRCLSYTLVRNPRDWVFNGPDGEVTVRVDGPLRANNGEALVAAGVRGLGILRAPTFIVGDELARGDLVPIMTHWQPPDMGIFAVYPHNRHLSAKVRRFVDFLSEWLTATPVWDAWDATNQDAPAQPRILGSPTRAGIDPPVDAASPGTPPSATPGHADDRRSRPT